MSTPVSTCVPSIHVSPDLTSGPSSHSALSIDIDDPKGIVYILAALRPPHSHSRGQESYKDFSPQTNAPNLRSVRRPIIVGQRALLATPTTFLNVI
jgi:hypothetical protein